MLLDFDSSLPVQLSYDASSYGVARILSHVINGGICSIAFSLRSLTQTEQNYSQVLTEKI